MIQFIERPARSPNLTPMHFFFLGYLESLSHQTKNNWCIEIENKSFHHAETSYQTNPYWPEWITWFISANKGLFTLSLVQGFCMSKGLIERQGRDVPNALFRDVWRFVTTIMLINLNISEHDSSITPIFCDQNDNCPRY